MDSLERLADQVSVDDDLAASRLRNGDLVFRGRTEVNAAGDSSAVAAKREMEGDERGFRDYEAAGGGGQQGKKGTGRDEGRHEREPRSGGSLDEQEAPSGSSDSRRGRLALTSIRHVRFRRHSKIHDPPVAPLHPLEQRVPLGRDLDPVARS